MVAGLHLGRAMAAVLVAPVAFALGCSSQGTPADDRSTRDGSISDGGAPATTDAGAIEGAIGATALDADIDEAGWIEAGALEAAQSSSCVPAIPQLSWTSPYAGWSRGIPKDPSFFPIAVWLQGSWHATEMQKLGINVYVGNNAGTDALAASDLATLKGLGMYAIIGQDSVGLANVDDTTIVGWWMDPDEPDNAQPVDGGYGPPVAPSTLVSRYDKYKSADSTRPVFVGLGQGVAYDGWEGRGSGAPPESDYVPAGDIVDFDIYPYNNCGGDKNEMATCGQFWLNAFGVDRLHQWSNRGQAVWTDIETTVINAKTTTGPTPAQTRSEVWLALIHSANGITYFVDTWNPSFREDGIFADSTMVNAVTALNAQIKSLAPELNSPSLGGMLDVTSSNSAAPLDVLVKANGMSLYVFSAVSRTGTTTGTFAVHGLTGNGVATVVGENRTVAVTGGSFSDAFAANDVHIYQIDLATVTCH